MTKTELINAIKATKARSYWQRGVRNYAVDMVAELEIDFADERITERTLLDGAPSWHKYSWYGRAYSYPRKICEALATPTEQKRKLKFDCTLPPNEHETWFDVQARALYQAAQLILETQRTILASEAE